MISGGNPLQRNSDSPVVLSAGGTGGHMFPAFSVARALLARGVAVALVTDTRGAKYLAAYPDIPFHVVRSETLRAGFLQKFRTVFDLAIGTAQAFFYLRKMRPRAVVGFGGYSSFPAVVAAQLLRIPTILHEQNAVLGLANRMLAGRALRIALSFPAIDALPEAWRRRVVVTGNPVRSEIVAVGTKPYSLPDRDFRILVLGGSQGAGVFSNMVPEAIGLLSDDLKARVRVVQQCRAADLDVARRLYDDLGVEARLENFISDVPAQLEACHLLIARSGASTVTEAAVAGRPAFFVPYPHHKDQQQRVNAQVLVRAKAALLFDEKSLVAADFAKELENLMKNPHILAEMAIAARKALPADAADRLADAILRF